MTIAESFKRFRREFNLKQKDVADALNVTPQAYQVYENKTVPTATVLMKIADAFNVSIDYLLGRIDVPNPYNKTSFESLTVEDRLSRLEQQVAKLSSQ